MELPEVEPQAERTHPRLSWERVGNEAVTQEDLIQAFSEVYWESVQDELCNLILVFQDIKRKFPQGLESGRLNDSSRFESSFVREFIENWDPLSRCRKFSSAEKKCYFDQLYKNIINTVKEHERDRSQTSDFIIARALLQTIGLLDIDIIYEYRPAPLPSHERLPLIEDLSVPSRHARVQTPTAEKVYRAIQCSNCRKVIRGNSYIECTQGCLDENSIHNYMNFERLKKGTNQTDNSHSKYRSRRSPWRLCRQCCAHTDHDPTHLSRMEYERHSNDQKKFSRVIDLWEDIYERPMGEWAENAVAAAMDPQMWFKAGNRHQALMFGPLVIEIGVPDSQGGVLISRREIPHLRFESTNTLIAGRTNLCTVETPQGLVEKMQVRVYAFTSKPQCRGLWKTITVAERNTVMASQKILCGGLLSGHNPAWAQMEEEMVKALLSSCESYKPNSNKSTAYNNNCLRKSALAIIEKFRTTIEPEIALYFTRFSQRLLDPKMDLYYNMFSNNCQKFCDNLLAERHNESFIPLYATPTALNPRNLGGPNFLLNFQGIMRAQNRELSTVQIYLTFCRDNSDVLDFNYFPYCSGYFSTTRSSLLQVGLPGTVYIRSAADIVWDFPCDSLSLVQTHLLRPRAAYGQSQPRQFYYQKLTLLSWLDTFYILAGAIIREFVHQAEHSDGLTEPLIWGIDRAYNESKEWTTRSMIKERFSKATWKDRSSCSKAQKAALFMLDLYDILTFTPRNRPILHSSRRLSFARKFRFRKGDIGWFRNDCHCLACEEYFHSEASPEMKNFRVFSIRSGKTLIAFAWTIAGQIRRIIWLVQPSTLERIFQATIKPCLCTACMFIFWKPFKDSLEKVLHAIQPL